MLDIINRYAHGFVAIPVILSFKKKGIFEQSEQQKSICLDNLITNTHANSGHLRVALRLLLSLGWLSQDATGAYSLTKEAESYPEIPDDILELLHLSTDSILAGQQDELLDKWIARSCQGWQVSQAFMADFLDGLLLIPVLLALKQYRDEPVNKEKKLFSPLNLPLREALSELFIKKDWAYLEKDGLALTAIGQFMLDRALITGVVASYAPMLLQMPELLFGSHQAVFQRAEFGEESHIDRKLNVLGSGFQHEKYFTQVDEIVLAIFNRLPYAEQPKYIADMGCGDGSLLKRVYQVICSQSARGKVLEQYPLTLLGIDYNQESLQETARTLANIPHRVLHGDIADPERMIAKLAELGIADPENILHIRSFLDHDRSYIPPENSSAMEDRTRLNYQGVYVDAEGQSISPAAMVQSLIEHLTRWASATSQHGLIVLEVHCLESATVQTFLDQSESLYFDACQAFSMQHLVEADVFLIAAAEAGLFAKPGFSRFSPKTFPFTRITLNWFEKQPYTIRHAHPRDLPVLLKLEKSWDTPLQVSEAVILQRLARFPEGQCVMVMNGEVVGVIYSQRIASVQQLEKITFAAIASLHRANAPVVQLIAVNILPEMQHLGLGNQLLEFMLQYCAAKGGIERVTGVTRCKNYVQHTDMPMEAYIQQRDEQGNTPDPILHFHQSHGAEIKGVIYNYRPEDVDNQGHGILIEYDIHHRVIPTASKPTPSPQKVDKNSEKFNLLESIEQSIRTIMSNRHLSDYSPKWTLREMGLDSLDLLELRSLLNRRFGVNLDPGFFFQYGTPQAISAYLARFITEQAGEDSAPMPTPENLQTKEQEDRKAFSNDAIAIIGMSCRFPNGANSPEAYWTLLKDGVDAISEIPENRWDNSRYYDPDPNKAGKIVTNMGGFLDQVDRFDAAFFRISPLEAESMDPQQRLLLEINWEALEHAGLSAAALANSQTGIFTGLFAHDYETLQIKQNQAEDYDAYFGTGNSSSIAAGRLAYFFDFKGPAISVDTACSSALVAIHLACQSLRQRECDLALASSVNLLLSAELSIAFSRAGMLAPDGHCKTFDASANGYVRSEGCAAIVLKRLSQAQADNDTVLAVIRGSAINQDGTSNGLTAPNGLAQEAVIRKALSSIVPADISYVEAHGTGTPLGDSVEIKALATVYGQNRSHDNPLVIGSVKTNIGHTEATAGLAGLLKVVLAMQHQYIPPHLHFKALNPHIDLNKIPARIPVQGVFWEKQADKPRLAGVSSFGFSGTNAHLIIEEAIQTKRVVSVDAPYIFVLSAKNKERLKAYAIKVSKFLNESLAVSNEQLSDVAYTLQVGREAMEERLAFTANSFDELLAKLNNFINGKETIEDFYCGSVKENTDTLKLFAAYEELQEAVDKWIEHKKYSRLLALWVKGLNFDWDKLYGKITPNRINLPTYPFAANRYWLKESAIKRNESGKIALRMKSLNLRRAEKNRSFTENTKLPAVLQEEPSQLMTFEEYWQEEPVFSESLTKIKTLLCFVSNTSRIKLFEKVLAALSPELQTIFIVAENRAKKVSKSHYTVSVRDEKSYQKALTQIAADYGNVDALLYLANIDGNDGIADYAPIVYLIQAVAATHLNAIRFLQAASLSEDTNRCYPESWLGFERSLGLVMPKLSFGIVYKEGETSVDEWGPLLWRELQREKIESCLYKEDKRYVWRVRETEIEAANSLIKANGTYLITGGCGGLGALFANYFAGKHPVNLILSGRSALDEQKRAQLKSLEAMGSRVVYLQADVSNYEAMQKELSKLRATEHFAKIDGIVHAAGIEPDHSTILEKPMASFNQVLAPKIAGTLVLDRLFSTQALDFICYFSSSSAILGDFGSCDYAIANRFLMAYTAYQNRMGANNRHVINWPLWKEGGMGFESDDSTKMYLKSSGQRFLEREEGLELFDRLLSQTNRQHLVLAGVPALIKRFLGLSKPQEVEKQLVTPFSSVSKTKGRRQQMKGFTLSECLEYDLKQQIGTLLKIELDELDARENLADFGFDSITLTELAARLTEFYEIDISPSVFFGNSTIEMLVGYFQNKHQQRIEKFYQESGEETQSQAVVPAKVAPPAQTITALTRQTKPRYWLKNTGQSTPEPIAIIGMSGRFPGARNIDELWQILTEGRETVTEIPKDRFDWRKNFSNSAQNMAWRCGMLPGVDEFDPLFFEISPREAKSMDPRQRLLLQESWKALEDAGYGAAKIKNTKMGMFVGVERGDFFAGGEKSVTSEHEGILAARLAYFLNFNGPIMAINTACSSGLVAAHQACQSLRSGECDTAIASAVNLMLSPKSFVEINAAGMLSPTGHCFAFDKRADGMTPGEAVVSLVFKRLADAQRDNDSIYAVIKGSAINYDGKTNGITVPNGNAQVELLKSVYDKYAINPEKIGYIVTHGTGTKLGDPVEINALYEAFKSYTQHANYCALTSSKTNFGHTFAASGLLSLVNLTLALRHQSIPASLHCQEENAYINWKESPFYVNKTLTPWQVAAGEQRLGAVSAFGVSGTNAHIVVESYAEQFIVPVAAQFYLLVFSATTESVLVEKIADMLDFLPRGNSSDNNDLAKISMTLSEGRHHFSYRNAIVVQDKDDAILVLTQLKNGEKSPKIFSGEVRAEFTGQNVIRKQIQELLKQAANSTADKESYREIIYALAELYCQGYEIPLSQIYGLDKPATLHLPTYPFAKQHYPIGEMRNDKTPTPQIFNGIHPLLQENTSNLLEQRFTSIFTGAEFFLSDHRVQGEKVLPGVAYLEMARKAVEKAALEENAQATIVLEHIVWAKPIRVADEAVTIHIGLFPEQDGEISYEIYSQPIQLEGEAVIHSQGIARLQPLQEPPMLDIAALKEKCSRKILPADECYKIFARLGLEYGAAFKGIENIYIGDGVALAKLKFSAENFNNSDAFILHPSLLDSALQACLGLSVESLGTDTELPFAMDKVEIFDRCAASMWAWVRAATSHAELKKFDIDLCDEQGRICVRMQGFSARILKKDTDTKEVSPVSSTLITDKTLAVGATLLTPVEKPFEFVTETTPIIAEGGILIIGGSERAKAEVIQCYPQASAFAMDAQDSIEAIAEKLKKQQPLAQIIWFGSEQPFDNKQLIAQQENGVLLLFKMIKALLALGYDSENLNWTVITSGISDASIHGLVGSMAKEYSNWKVRLIALEFDSIVDFTTLLSVPFDPDGDAVFFRDRQWYKEYLLPVNDFKAEYSLYRKQGVYVVIGGAGGIGAAWSEYMIRDYQAQIIWIGRREKDDEIAAKIKAIGTPEPLYICADATDLASLQQAYQEIKRHYPNINGVIHSALVLSDKSLMNMQEQAFRASLAPKVDASVYLTEVFGAEALDFMLFFSAMQSFTKAAGQSNYAAGCAFSDAFAKYFARDKQYPVKIMNWGYWGSVGVVASAKYREQMEKQGLGSIEPDEAMVAVEKLLVATFNQAAFIKTIHSNHAFKQQIITAPGITIGSP